MSSTIIGAIPQEVLSALSASALTALSAGLHDAPNLAGSCEYFWMPDISRHKFVLRVEYSRMRVDPSARAWTREWYLHARDGDFVVAAQGLEHAAKGLARAVRQHLAIERLGAGGKTMLEHKRPMTVSQAADYRACLAAIHAEPAEDAHRLIFSDLLEEQGVSLWPEFIRAQVELTNLQETGNGRCVGVSPKGYNCEGPSWRSGADRQCRWCELCAVENRVFAHWGNRVFAHWDEHLPTGQEAWSEPFRLHGSGIHWERGFIAEAHGVSLTEWAHFGPRLLTVHPVRSFELHHEDAHHLFRLSTIDWLGVTLPQHPDLSLMGMSCRTIIPYILHPNGPLNNLRAQSHKALNEAMLEWARREAWRMMAEQ